MAIKCYAYLEAAGCEEVGPDIRGPGFHSQSGHLPATGHWQVTLSDPQSSHLYNGMVVPISQLLRDHIRQCG